MNNYKLYVLVDKNEPSNIKYVGQTKNTLKYRLSKHKSDSVNKYKTNWINKIGKENLMIVLMQDNLSHEEVNLLEISLIAECKLIGYKLTNITNGGKGWERMKMSETHRKNISLNHADVKGINNPMFGKKHTNETIEKIKEKIRISYIEGKTFTPERLLKMSNKKRGENNNMAILTKREVLLIRQLSLEGVPNYILARTFNMNVPAIWKIINRYTWKHI